MTGGGLLLAAALGIGSTATAVCAGVWLRAMSTERRRQDAAAAAVKAWDVSYLGADHGDPFTQLITGPLDLQAVQDEVERVREQLQQREAESWLEAVRRVGFPEPVDLGPDPVELDQPSYGTPLLAEHWTDAGDPTCGPPRARTGDGWGYRARHPQDRP